MLALLVLTAVLAGAIWTDLACRRIPNWLILSGLLAGLLLNLLTPPGIGLFLADAGGTGGLSAVLGSVVGGGMLFPLWLLRTMGAGDVKLMAVVGAFLGPWQSCGAVLLSAIAGGVLALMVAVYSGVLMQVWGNLRLMLLCLVIGKGGGVNVDDIRTTGRLPYALAISSGAVAQILLARFTGWPFV